MTEHAALRERQVALRRGWFWTRVGDLRPGDVQHFAGVDLVVRRVSGYGKFVDVDYEVGRSRTFAAATEVGVRARAVPDV